MAQSAKAGSSPLDHAIPILLPLLPPELVGLGVGEEVLVDEVVGAGAATAALAEVAVDFEEVVMEEDDTERCLQRLLGVLRFFLAKRTWSRRTTL